MICISICDCDFRMEICLINNTLKSEKKKLIARKYKIVKNRIIVLFGKKKYPVTVTVDYNKKVTR